MLRSTKLAFAAGILMAFGATGAASAADMALKARPPAVSLYNWTGCYIGGNVGGGWDRTDTTRATIDGVVGFSPANYGRESDSGVMGGGQAGCDFQTGNLVFGVQGQFDFGSIKGQHALTDFPAFSETNNLQDVITATGRFGYLFTPSFLGYGKLGVAFMHDRNQVFSPGGAPFESASFTMPGMTVGGGVEWMFTPNWSVFAEYNYMWIEDLAGQHFNAAPGSAGGEVLNIKPVVQTALVGVNYKFHWDGGPVVAKY
jgi:outer membrane immunogenic protein